MRVAVSQIVRAAVCAAALNGGAASADCAGEAVLAALRMAAEVLADARSPGELALASIELRYAIGTAEAYSPGEPIVADAFSDLIYNRNQLLGAAEGGDRRLVVRRMLDHRFGDTARAAAETLAECVSWMDLRDAAEVIGGADLVTPDVGATGGRGVQAQSKTQPDRRGEGGKSGARASDGSEGTREPGAAGRSPPDNRRDKSNEGKGKPEKARSSGAGPQEVLGENAASAGALTGLEGLASLQNGLAEPKAAAPRPSPVEEVEVDDPGWLSKAFIAKVVQALFAVACLIVGFMLLRHILPRLRRRARRFACCEPATLKWTGGGEDVLVIDISRFGARVRSDIELWGGEPVQLTIGDHSMGAVVVWRGNGNFGVEFNAALARSSFKEIRRRAATGAGIAELV